MKRVKSPEGKIGGGRAKSPGGKVGDGGLVKSSGVVLGSIKPIAMEMESSEVGYDVLISPTKKSRGYHKAVTMVHSPAVVGLLNATSKFSMRSPNGVLLPQQEISEESDLRSSNSELWSPTSPLKNIPRDHCTKDLENTDEMWKSHVKKYFGN